MAEPDECATPSGFDAHTGLVVVDVQNDFADPDGSLSIAGGEHVVSPINNLVQAAVSAGAIVVYTQDWHPPHTPHFQAHGGPWPVHCVAGTWGAQLHPRLQIAGPVVRKGVGPEDGYSGFTSRELQSGADRPTELHALLANHGATDLVVVGLALDVCVRATALDALHLGYHTAVLRSCTQPIAARPDDVASTVEALLAAGVDVL